jgi:predicted nucleotidyltransferase
LLLAISRFRTRQSFLHIRFRIQRIGLFGSYARNEAGPESDIDIIVEFMPDTDNLYENKQLIAQMLSSRFSQEIDIAREKYLKPRMKEKIIKEALYV